MPSTPTLPSPGGSPLLSQFLAYLKAEEGRSDNTVAAYRRDLRDWESFMAGAAGRPLEPADMTVADLRTWLASLGRRGMAPTTMRRKVQSLRAFFNYLMRRHGLRANPAADLRLPRPPRPLPVFVRQDETMAMLGQAADRSRQECADGDGVAAFLACRDALILDILYTTGLRASELTGLPDNGVDTARRTLRTLGKGRKERIVPFGSALAAAVDSYRGMRDALWGTACADGPLLLSRRGAPMNRRELYAVVHKAMADAGVHASRMSPHVLRHSCATDLLRAGAALDNVRTLLGHASLATTQVYTHISDRELRDNYLNAHPRARK